MRLAVGYDLSSGNAYNGGNDMTDYIDKIFLGDCEIVLRDLPSESVDLIFTSPPYADQRQKTYGALSRMTMWTGFCPRPTSSFAS